MREASAMSTVSSRPTPVEALLRLAAEERRQVRLDRSKIIELRRDAETLVSDAELLEAVVAKSEASATTYEEAAAKLEGSTNA